MNYLLFRLKNLCLYSITILKLNKLFHNFWNVCKFRRRVEELNRLSIFDYEELALPMIRYYTDYVPENNDKNMGRCLKEYMNIDVKYSINAMIEHGLFFGDFVARREYILKVPSIITFGDQRIQHLRNKKVGKQVIPIGPYIHYAHILMKPEDFSALKKKLGRVLLVFPSHSLNSEGAKSIYSIKEFTDEIDKIGKDFDTIIISLHYSDINLAKDYEAKGYKCVSSGYTNDPHFMHRQRTIIELSDVTMSNAVGTHVGYCIYLNKPHYIFKQTIRRTQNAIYRNIEESYRDINIYTQEIKEVEEAFGKYCISITEDQYNVANKYWGFKYIKTPKELKSLLSFSRI